MKVMMSPIVARDARKTINTNRRRGRCLSAAWLPAASARAESFVPQALHAGCPGPWYSVGVLQLGQTSTEFIDRTDILTKLV
jgi:hypothetical protein